MMRQETWRVRLIAFVAAIACLGLAFAYVTAMPGILMMMFLGAMVIAPLLVFTQGWLGVWLLALGGLWAMGMGPTLMSSGITVGEFGLVTLVLMGLSALYVAIIPPHVAARRRAAWPFGYLNPQRAALKSKRDRLLMEEEIVYDVVEDYWEDDDEDERAFPVAKRKSSMR
ncbi:MAG: hypothetical protein GX613_07395 [Chloroflexi bacterium]|nr:hypothetical protein [Chloroflexota bacterium]